jgi:hypothetical protein
MMLWMRGRAASPPAYLALAARAGTHRPLHTSPLLLQTTAKAKTGAGAKANKSRAALDVAFQRTLQEAAQKVVATADLRQFDMTRPILPRHQLIYTAASAVPIVSNGWTPRSMRTGVLALKCGITTDYDYWGVAHALTALKVCTFARRRLRDSRV